MPILTLKLACTGQDHRPTDARTQARLGQALTTLTADCLAKRAEVTAVVIEPLPPGAWYIGGQPVERPTALLEIAITAGTNTAAQKADFIARAHRLLQEHLAPGAALAEASYVAVRELPAGDWGYGGHTQAARRLPAAPARG